MSLFPRIDLTGALPITVLALIAIMCIVALLVRTFLRSRAAGVIAVVICLIVVGPVLTGSLAGIINALVPLGVLAIVAWVVVMWMLHRDPALRDLWRECVAVIGKRPAEPPPTIIDQPKAVTARRRRLSVKDRNNSEWW